MLPRHHIDRIISSDSVTRPNSCPALDTADCTLTHHVEALCAWREALHLAVALHEGAQAEAKVLCDVVAHAYCQPSNHCQGNVLHAEAALISGRYTECMVMLLGAQPSPPDASACSHCRTSNLLPLPCARRHIAFAVISCRHGEATFRKSSGRNEACQCREP